MFEKLKEYWLYIVLWLIALWALAYAFLSTSNAQKGWEVVSKIQDKLVTAIAKNQKVKDKTTIVDHLWDLNWLTIGSYKLNTEEVLFLNEKWDDAVTSWTVTWNATTTAWELKLVMMPNEKIASVSEATLTLKTKEASATKKANGTEAEQKAFKELNEQARWFLATGYVWFWNFANETDAKEFRDSYFSTWIVTCKDIAATWNTNCTVFIEIAR